MQHIIKKQNIDLQLKGKVDSFRIQQKLSDQYWKFLIPLLEEEFNKIAPEEEVIWLDRLEIDLGTIKEVDLDKMASDPNMISLIKSQVHDFMSRALSIGKTAVRRSVSANSFYQWLFYMRNGFLSWNVSAVCDQWYNNVLEELAIDAQNVLLFKETIKGSRNILDRLIRQHPQDFLIRIIEILTAEQQIQLRNKLAELQKELKVSAPDHEMSEATIYESFWRQVFEMVAIEEGKNISQHLEALIDNFGKNSLIIDSTRIEMSIESETLVDDRSDEKEGQLYLQNVGLVLIHPFLSSLFKNLELMDGKQFIDRRAQEKAIYLLFYAATGKIEAKEYELVIPKILCGYAIALPIPIDTILSDTEKEEVDAMLWAAISSWELLKNTSPDGLREGFLQRSGKVFNSSEKIECQVEKRGVDLLLDHLPWNLSIIKLPWLNQVIKVEWR